jgi:predicted transcriptional regulator
MPSAPKPTRAELAILRVLWTRGAATVRQVHDELAADRPTAYTTTLKLIQIMTDKGLVTRAEQNRQHVYRARQSETAMQKRLVRDLLDRAFDGSSARLVMQALAAKPASPDELREIRRLLDEQDEQDQKDQRVQKDHKDPNRQKEQDHD